MCLELGTATLGIPGWTAMEMNLNPLGAVGDQRKIDAMTAVLRQVAKGKKEE